MWPERIDIYNYCSSTNNKTKDYKKDKYSEEEMEKTRRIRKDILDFLRSVLNRPDYHDELLESDTIHNFICYELYTGIHYNDSFGYISKGNYDRDLVQVYYYGSTHDEALRTAFYEIIDDLISHCFGIRNNEEANKDFFDRFKNGIYENDEIHGEFIFAENTLQILTKYYGENVPEEFITELDDYIKRMEKLDLTFNFETMKYEKKEQVKTLKRTRGEING